ncbi:MAG: SurA N-terminal domain-containing protein [Bacteroidota bacterium]|jgi:peptidyl-prolyl cis-trans isomerase
MATLGRIRNHGVLLLIVIGVALLIFIVTDFVNNGSTFFREQKANVGSIDGDKVKYNDFLASLNQMQDFYKVERGQNIDDQMSEQIRQEVWNQIVMRQVIEKDARNIGMGVSKQELSDLIMSKNPSPLIMMRPVFQNPETGMFDPNIVANFIKELESADGNKNANPEQVVLMKNYWKFIETNVKFGSLFEKYNTLLTKSLVTNTKEAQFAYNNSKYSVDVLYAMKPYFTIADSTVKVADSDVEALYKKKKEQFKQDPYVDIDFVVFPIKPSEEDIDAVRKQVETAKVGFVAVNDSLLTDTVNFNSDVPYRDVFLAQGDIPSDLRDFAFSADRGVVFGPVFVDNTFKIAKVVDTKQMSDSVKLSFIAIQEATAEATKAKVDSVLGLAKQTPFATLAQQYSADKQSSSRGGDIGWVRQVTLSPELLRKVSAAAINEPFVMSQGSAASIFVVTERTKPVKMVKLAVIERNVATSNGTQAKIFQEAKQFAGLLGGSGSDFDKKAKEKNYQVIPANTIDRNFPRLLNIPETRQVIRWAFDSKVGATSDVFECGDNLVVATVKRMNKEGYKTLDEVKPQLLSELRKDKKFDMMKGLFAGKTIDRLRDEGLSVDTIKGLTFASNSAGSLGFDAAMIANAPFAEVNKLSAPMKGNIGAFVFQVLSKTENPEPFDLKQMKYVIGQQNSGLFYYVLEALKKAYKVKDERYNLF